MARRYGFGSHRLLWRAQQSTSVFGGYGSINASRTITRAPRGFSSTITGSNSSRNSSCSSLLSPSTPATHPANKTAPISPQPHWRNLPIRQHHIHHSQRHLQLQGQLRPRQQDILPVHIFIRGSFNHKSPLRCLRGGPTGSVLLFKILPFPSLL